MAGLFDEPQGAASFPWMQWALGAGWTPTDTSTANIPMLDPRAISGLGVPPRRQADHGLFNGMGTGVGTASRPSQQMSPWQQWLSQKPVVDRLSIAALDNMFPGAPTSRYGDGAGWLGNLINSGATVS